MKALVTGATGFIGSKLVERLKKENWKVSALVRDKRLPGKLNTKNVKIVEGSLEDIDLLKEASDGVDVVFNAAAALPYHNLSKEKYFIANVFGVENLMKACIASKVKRVIHVSTVGIYGKPSVYSLTKLKGEKIVQKYSKKGLKTVIVRPTIAYGPGDTRPGFLNLLRLIKKGVFVPVGEGDNYFHTIYIDNLIDALLVSAVNPKAVDGDFIIGDDPVPKMKEILLEMQKVTGKKILPFYIPVSIAFAVAIVFDLFKKIGLLSPLNTQRVRFLTENLKFDTQKAKKILGFTPHISLEKGIVYTYSWYKKKGFIK